MVAESRTESRSFGTLKGCCVIGRSGAKVGGEKEDKKGGVTANPNDTSSLEGYEQSKS